MPKPPILPSDVLDQPAIRQAGRDALSLALIDARNHTLHLLAGHERAAAAPGAGIGPEVHPSPALWLAGRAGWFAEQWIGRNTLRALGSACPPQPPRLASIEPHADDWWSGDGAPAPARGVSAPPGFDGTRVWLLETLETTLDLLAGTPEHDDALYFYRLALCHEDLLGERLVVLAQTLGLPLGLPEPAAMTPRAPLVVPAARWTLGSAPGGFVFDNEKWAHPVALPDFEIDAQPVTWAQYIEFVDDGGYDRPELWQADGWAWLQAAEAGGGRRGPRHVEQIGVARFGGAGAVLQRRFGQAVRLAGHHPVTHASWWEADAWCRWAGRRLPDEGEWEVAAHTLTRRGFRWGEVHEWTASRFQPYPGFEPGPWSVYSVPQFGRARVMRGASWVTRSRMKHPKWRGFALPAQDDAFVGFRSCAQ
jgi:ergothioneine biosynthesis protein EgtB